MRVLTVLALAFSLSAVAGEYATKKFSFSPATYTGAGTRTWYNCDSVRDSAESALEKLGASSVRLSCSGGIGWGQPFPTPVVISGTFDAPVGTGTGTSMVELRGFSGCEFNSQFLDYIVPMFDGARIVKRSGMCSTHRDSWRYTVEVQN